MFSLATHLAEERGEMKTDKITVGERRAETPAWRLESMTDISTSLE